MKHIKPIKYLVIFTVTLYLLFVNISTTYCNSLENDFIQSSPPEINSEGGILIDAKTGTILYEKNANSKYYPASITKVMTGLIALENIDNLDERIYMSHEAVFSLPNGSSNIAMDEDETLSFDESMYAIMLESANEVSNGIAEYIGQTNENFGKIMTERAKELGAFNTNFLNPHGLHDDDHYSTPFDMALILREAVKNDDFKRYISTLSSKIPPTERKNEERPLNNSNKLIHPGGIYFNKNIVGGKTGFTSMAEHTLVSYGKKDGVELICVIMKGKKGEPYSDSNLLYEYGFNNFSNINILNANDYDENLTIRNEKGNIIGETHGYIKDDFNLNVPNNFNKDNIILNPRLDLINRVNVNSKIGTLEIISNGEVLGTKEIYAKTSINLITTNRKSAVKEDIVDEEEDNKLFIMFNKFIPEGKSDLIKTFLSFLGIVIGILIVFIIIKLLNKLVKNYRHNKYKEELQQVLNRKYKYKLKKKYKYKHD